MNRLEWQRRRIMAAVRRHKGESWEILFRFVHLVHSLYCLALSATRGGIWDYDPFGETPEERTRYCDDKYKRREGRR